MSTIRNIKAYLHRLLAAAKSFTKTIAFMEESSLEAETRKQPCPVPRPPGLNAR